jgi:hypothetical protein
VQDAYPTRRAVASSKHLMTWSDGEQATCECVAPVELASCVERGLTLGRVSGAGAAIVTVCSPTSTQTHAESVRQTDLPTDQHTDLHPDNIQIDTQISSIHPSIQPSGAVTDRREGIYSARKGAADGAKHEK